MICTGPDCPICRLFDGPLLDPAASWSAWKEAALARRAAEVDKEPKTQEEIWADLRPWYQRTPDHDYMDIRYEGPPQDVPPRQPVRPRAASPLDMDKARSDATWGGVKVDPVAELVAEVDRERSADEKPVEDIAIDVWSPGGNGQPVITGPVPEALRRTGMLVTDLLQFIKNGVTERLRDAFSTAGVSPLDIRCVVVALPEQWSYADDPADTTVKYLRATATLHHERLWFGNTWGTVIDRIHIEA